MPFGRFTVGFCLPLVLADGLNERASNYAALLLIIRRSIYDVVLVSCGLAKVMPPRSGTSSVFCAVKA
jgi:hypothetical protein